MSRLGFLLLMWGLATNWMLGATVLSMGRSNGAAGTTVAVKLGLASDSNLVGVQVDFGFDPALVAPGTVQRGEALGSLFKVASSVVRPGVLRVVLYSESNALLRDGAVLVVPLTLLQTVPSGQRGLSLLEVQLADSGGMNRSYALAPFVEILSPGAGDQMAVGTPVTVEVEAVPATGDLQQVQLYIDGALAGSRVAAPYSFSWTPAERGTHDLLVVASDEGSTPAEAGRALYILSRFDEWKGEYFTASQQANPFVSGFGSDPDADGVANGIEYLAGTNPLAADAQAPLTTELMKIGGQYFLTVTLESPAGINDLSFIVYATGQLDRSVGVAPQPALLVEEIQVGELTRRTYRDPVPVTDGPRFLYIESTIRP